MIPQNGRQAKHLHRNSSHAIVDVPERRSPERRDPPRVIKEQLSGPSQLPQHLHIRESSHVVMRPRMHREMVPIRDHLRQDVGIIERARPDEESGCALRVGSEEGIELGAGRLRTVVKGESDHPSGCMDDVATVEDLGERPGRYRNGVDTGRVRYRSCTSVSAVREQQRRRTGRTQDRWRGTRDLPGRLDGSIRCYPLGERIRPWYVLERIWEVLAIAPRWGRITSLDSHALGAVPSPARAPKVQGRETRARTHKTSDMRRTEKSGLIQFHPSTSKFLDLNFDEPLFSQMGTVYCELALQLGRGIIDFPKWIDRGTRKFEKLFLESPPCVRWIHLAPSRYAYSLICTSSTTTQHGRTDLQFRMKTFHGISTQLPRRYMRQTRQTRTSAGGLSEMSKVESVRTARPKWIAATLAALPTESAPDPSGGDEQILRLLLGVAKALELY